MKPTLAKLVTDSVMTLVATRLDKIEADNQERHLKVMDVLNKISEDGDAVRAFLEVPGGSPTVSEEDWARLNSVLDQAAALGTKVDEINTAPPAEE